MAFSFPCPRPPLATPTAVRCRSRSSSGVLRSAPYFVVQFWCGSDIREFGKASSEPSLRVRSDSRCSPSLLRCQCVFRLVSRSFGLGFSLPTALSSCLTQAWVGIAALHRVHAPRVFIQRRWCRLSCCLRLVDFCLGIVFVVAAYAIVAMEGDDGCSSLRLLPWYGSQSSYPSRFCVILASVAGCILRSSAKRQAFIHSRGGRLTQSSEYSNWI